VIPRFRLVLNLDRFIFINDDILASLSFLSAPLEIGDESCRSRFGVSTRCRTSRCSFGWSREILRSIRDCRIERKRSCCGIILEDIVSSHPSFDRFIPMMHPGAICYFVSRS
jgi:hypothetical protein